MTGLSAYLLVAIVGMVMVKTTTSSFQRLRDCRWLLLALLVTSGVYALPELFIRTTVSLGGGSGQDICILGVYGVTYALYVAFRSVPRVLGSAQVVEGLILAEYDDMVKYFTSWLIL